MTYRPNGVVVPMQQDVERTDVVFVRSSYKRFIVTIYVSNVANVMACCREKNLCGRKPKIANNALERV